MKKNNQKYKKLNQKKSLNNDIVKIWQNDVNDPNGSYVGTFSDGSRPVQDADDL